MILTRLVKVLAESVERAELTEEQAVSIVRRALFDNSNKLYNLGLTADMQFGINAARKWLK